MFKRPTSLANAFINAVVETHKTEKVDHQRGTGNWIARRVSINAERPGFGMVTEYDKRPEPQKDKSAVVLGIIAAGASSHLMDEEILGLD